MVILRASNAQYQIKKARKNSISLSGHTKVKRNIRILERFIISTALNVIDTSAITGVIPQI